MSRWLGEYRRRGSAGLQRAGRKPLLDAAQRQRLTALLLEGPEAHGFPTPLWTCPRVACLIRDEFGVYYHEGHVWKILRAWAGAPNARSARCGNSMKRRCAPGSARSGRHLKKARTEGRELVFIDESGLSQKPHCCRSWAPRGQTPVLQFNFNWDKLYVSAGMTLRHFYFRLYQGAIGQAEVIDFIKALVYHIDQPLLIVWGGGGIIRDSIVIRFSIALFDPVALLQIVASAHKLYIFCHKGSSSL